MNETAHITITVWEFAGWVIVPSIVFFVIGLFMGFGEKLRKDESATAGTAEGGASEVPGHVDDARTSSFAWVCERRGTHKFVHVLTPRKCTFCGLGEETA